MLGDPGRRERSISLSTAAPVIFEDPLRAACPATCPRLPDEAGIDLAHRFVEANGVRFHLVEAGDRARPLVLLLHGFPEFWYGWRAQIGRLASHGLLSAADADALQRGWAFLQRLSSRLRIVFTTGHSETRTLPGLRGAGRNETVK